MMPRLPQEGAAFCFRLQFFSASLAMLGKMPSFLYLLSLTALPESFACLTMFAKTTSC